jgi:hypothetical protein
MAIVALWLTPYLAYGLGKALGLRDEASYAVSFVFNQGVFFAVLPVVPFWLLAESRPWGRRHLLPLGSYLVFIVLFFPILFLFLFNWLGYGSHIPALGLAQLLACFLGRALLAGGAGYGYYRFWRHRLDRLPPVIPDVF